MAGNRAVQVIGPSYHLADRKAAVQRAVNWRLQQTGGLGEDKQATMQAAPGLVPLIDFGAPTRGIFATEAREFVVAGATLYETTTGAAVALGTISGGGPVDMDDGTAQVVIVNGPQGYVLNLSTNILAQITDPDWRGSYSVSELNGTFVFVALDAPDQFYLSAIDDASSLDALDFSSSDAQPDSLLTTRTLKQEEFMFGTRSTEVWIYAPDPVFPLLRYSATPIDIGLVGRRAVIKAADTLVFVGCTERGTGIVYMMQGHQPVRISTNAVEEALQASGVNLSECSMWVQQTVGAEFVGINAPGLETTWCWDAGTREWHELGELVDGDWSPLRIAGVVSFGGQHHAIAGNKLYRLADDVPTIDGSPMTYERTWPHLQQPSFEPVSHRSVELQCTTGEETAGSITLECSNDGGYVFLPPLQRSMGATGRRMQRVRWQGLGSAQDRVYRLRATGVHVNLNAANLDAG
jgi:hypothetical protein